MTLQEIRNKHYNEQGKKILPLKVGNNISVGVSKSFYVTAFVDIHNINVSLYIGTFEANTEWKEVEKKVIENFSHKIVLEYEFTTEYDIEHKWTYETSFGLNEYIEFFKEFNENEAKLDSNTVDYVFYLMFKGKETLERLAKDTDFIEWYQEQNKEEAQCDFNSHYSDNEPDWYDIWKDRQMGD